MSGVLFYRIPRTARRRCLARPDRPSRYDCFPRRSDACARSQEPGFSSSVSNLVSLVSFDVLEDTAGATGSQSLWAYFGAARYDVKVFDASGAAGSAVEASV